MPAPCGAKVLLPGHAVQRAGHVRFGHSYGGSAFRLRGPCGPPGALKQSVPPHTGRSRVKQAKRIEKRCALRKEGPHPARKTRSPSPPRNEHCVEEGLTFAGESGMRRCRCSVPSPSNDGYALKKSCTGRSRIRQRHSASPFPLEISSSGTVSRHGRERSASVGGSGRTRSRRNGSRNGARQAFARPVLPGRQTAEGAGLPLHGHAAEAAEGLQNICAIPSKAPRNNRKPEENLCLAPCRSWGGR